MHVLLLWTFLSLCTFTLGNVICYQDVLVFYIQRLSIDNSNPDLLLELQTQIQLPPGGTSHPGCVIVLANLVSPQWNS